MDRLWNANYLRAWGANFMLFFSFMLVVPLLPIYLQEQFGASKETIGVVLSGYTAVALLTRAASGFVVDRYPKKQILMLGFVLLTLFFAGYVAAGSLLLFAAVRTLHGFPFGLSTVANSTVAVDVLPTSRRAEGIGYYGLSNNVATAISPSIGLWMYETWHDFDLLFWTSMGVAALGVWCVAGIKDLKAPLLSPLQGEDLKLQSAKPTDAKTSIGINDCKTATEQTEAATEQTEAPTPANPSDKSTAAPATNDSNSNSSPRSGGKRGAVGFSRFFLLPAWPQAIAIACYSFAYGVVSTYVAIYGREELGLMGGSGAFFALLASGLFVSRLFGSRTLRRGRIVFNATVGSCISALGYLLFAALHNEVGFYGCAILVGLGNGHLWPAFQNMFINIGSATQRGVANASLLTSWDLGVGLGVIAGGSLIERCGYHTAFWSGWIIEAIGVCFYLSYVRRHYLYNTQPQHSPKR